MTGEEELFLARFGAMILGFLGVVVLMCEGAIQLGSASLLANLAVVLVSACYAAGNLIALRLDMVAPAKLACISLIIASSFMVPSATMNNLSHPASWEFETWRALC